MVACPHCGGEIEFWKDEPFRVCQSCRQEVRNPKHDFGCAEWCRHASGCVGPKGSTRGAEAFKVPASAAASQPAERGGEPTADPSAATG